MSRSYRRFQRALFILVAALMGFSLIAPVAAFGLGLPGTDLAPGDALYQDGESSTDESTEDTGEGAEESSDAGSSIPWQQPIDYGVVVDNNGDLGGGLICRTAPSSGASEITRLWPGESVEVVGDAQWAEGLEFLPVNCGGVGGFVKGDYVQMSWEAPAETNTEEAVEEEPVEEEAVEEEQSAEEEAAADDGPVVGDLVVTVLDPNGQPVPGICFDLYSNDGWVANTCDSADAVPNNGNSGFFGLPAGTYTAIATTSDVEQVTVWVEPGDTAYVTAYASSAQAAPEETGTEETTEEVVTEEPVEEEVVPTEIPSTPVVEEEVTEEVVPTEEPSTPVVEEETVEVSLPEDETEGEEVPATPEVTEVPTEEIPATPEVTEEPAQETPASPEVTEEPTEEVPTEEAPASPTAETPEETATAAPGVDLSKAIGDATVTGTNGEGVRCRVAPDNESAIITTLPEGATVFVLVAPANDFIGVACGNQLGYVNVHFMWSGGAGEEIPDNAGSLVVVGTGGQSLNCRSGAGSSYPVITSVPSGSILTSRGPSSNGWAPVVCNGRNGFVSIAYVEVSGGGSGTPTPGTTVPQGTTGTVTNTGGDSLNCRTSPGGTVITRVAEGTVLTVRGATSNGWVPVVCGGANGYVSAQYFTVGGTGTGTTPTPTPGTGPSSGYVKVTGTGGGSLNCRSAASLSGMIISRVPYGATLAVRGATTNGWVPVDCGGKNGYVSAMYVTSTTAPGGSEPTPTPPSGGTGTATIANAGGDNVNCRTAPGGSVITSLPEGTKVTTRGASSGGWTPVVCAAKNGYISSQFLSTSGGSNPTPTPTQTPGGGGYAVGDHVKITSNANMRYEASANANLLMTVPAGEVLLVRGGVTNGYVAVDYDGLKGWVITGVAVKTTEPLSERGGSGNEPSPTPTTPAPGGGSTSIVNFAMRYIGYPYVSATHGPSSFDCSGFTYWVIKNVLGYNIGTGTWTQTQAGTPVSRGSLQPGDLVFFQNTYKAGLSHVGIYIGNDNFIHAENESTGVRISSLSSTYYSSRWYGAVRIR